MLKEDSRLASSHLDRDIHNLISTRNKLFHQTANSLKQLLRVGIRIHISQDQLFFYVTGYTDESVAKELPSLQPL